MEVIQLPAKVTHRPVDRLWPHPDGRQVVALTGAALTSETLTWWDVVAGKRLQAVEPPRAPITAHPAFAPDHSWYAAGGDLKQRGSVWGGFHIWFGVGAARPKYAAFAFTPDAATFLAARRHRGAGRWALDRWSLTPDRIDSLPQVVLAGGAVPGELAVSPDGRTLYALARDRGLSRYGLPDGARLDWRVEWSGHVRYQVVLSPDGSTVALDAPGGTHLFDAHAPGPPRTVPGGHRQAAAFTPDSRRVVTADRDGTAGVWDAATGACVARYDWLAAVGRLHSVAVAPDGLTAYAGGDGGRIIRWDLPD